MNDFFIDESIGYIIGRTSMALQRELEKQFHAHGYAITAPQWAVISRLSEEDGLTQNEIAKRTFKDKTTVARILARLEEHGHIVRRQDPDDRRYHSVYLTDKGKRLNEALVPLTRDVLHHSQKGLDTQQIQDLIATMNQIYKNIT